MDAVLFALNNDDAFKKKFRKVCGKKGCSYVFGTTSRINLEHVSKPNHGPQDEVSVQVQSYSSEECLILVALFECYSNPYTYYDADLTQFYNLM